MSGGYKSLARPLNVLSLFDGISCGQVALQRAGIPVAQYFASEIDKHAIATTTKNWPDTVQLGDIQIVKATDLPQIDLLIGGSPCQGFSRAGRRLAFDDPRSKLFFEFMRLYNETWPEFFMLENVRMAKEHKDVITRLLGVEPAMLDAVYISAQRRPRLYWTNICYEPFIKTSPQQRIRDVLRYQSDVIDVTKRFYAKRKGTQVYTKAYSQLVSPCDKAFTLLAGGNRISNSGSTNIAMSDYRVVVPSPDGAEALHGLPRGYTTGVKKQRYRQIGNGWHVDVVTHIFRGLHNVNTD